MNRPICIAGVLTLLPLAPGAAQESPPVAAHVQPRAMADPTFAVGLSLSDLAAQMRSGTVSMRKRRDDALRVDVEALATVAARRKRPEFLASVPLWDLRFDSLSFEQSGDHELRVSARVYLATDPEGVERARLHFRRSGDDWRLVSYSGLREFLGKQKQRLAKNPKARDNGGSQ